MRLLLALSVLCLLVLIQGGDCKKKEGEKNNEVESKKDAAHFHHYKKKHIPRKAMFVCRRFANCPGPRLPLRIRNSDRFSCCLGCVQKRNKKNRLVFSARAESFDCLCKCPACAQLRG
uniref:Cnidarian restricted protein n=1 Tax=Clytia hemisphaerica TaxID=252671 RepID=A0A7M5VHG2_9CNID